MVTGIGYFKGTYLDRSKKTQSHMSHMVTRVSQNGSVPCCVGSSIVNWMCGSTHPIYHRIQQHLQCISLQKTTHTDQYLHWDSNHHITAKQSVYNTLAHRAKTVSSTKETLDKELQHIRGALQACQPPNWALSQLHQRFLKNNQTHQDINGTNNSIKDNNTNNNIKKRNISLVVPYI